MFTMKANRESLLTVLQKVSATTKRAFNPILSTVRIEAKDGYLTAMGCDFDTYVRSLCECEGELGPCCVAPGPLMALCGFGGESVELTHDGTRLKVDCGPKGAISTMDAQEFPQWPTDLADIGADAGDLADCIEAVAWAADAKEQRPLCRAVWIIMDSKAKTMTGFATNRKACAYTRK